MTSPHLPSLPFLDVETSRGKRTTQLDLDAPADAEKLRTLVRDADVFVQSYRPGGLAGRGFGPEVCAAMRPGIVHASLAAFSPGGPWQDVKSVSPHIALFFTQNERTRMVSVCFGSLIRSCRLWAG